MSGPPLPKPSRDARKRAERKARRARQAFEHDQKDLVRQRDTRCRFPKCECHGRHGLAAEGHVSHLQHKGMGGNPSGDRSTRQGMVLLCAWRHRESPYSIDSGAITWAPTCQTMGADRAIKWLIKAEAMMKLLGPGFLSLKHQEHVTPGSWFTFAREIRPGVLRPLMGLGAEVVEALASEWVLREFLTKTNRAIHT